MELSSSVAVFLLTTIVLLGMSSATDNSHTCRNDQYYNRKLMACVPCSPCGQENPVFLRACYKDKDTLCGQLRKFQFRQSVFADVDNNAVEGSEIDVTVDVTKGDKQTATTLLVAKDETGGLWFILTMVLIAILVLLSVAVVILLFAWCFICKRKQREMVIDPVYTNSLLRFDDQGAVRKMEQFKLVTET